MVKLHGLGISASRIDNIRPTIFKVLWKGWQRGITAKEAVREKKKKKNFPKKGKERQSGMNTVNFSCGWRGKLVKIDLGFVVLHQFMGASKVRKEKL